MAITKTQKRFPRVSAVVVETRLPVYSQVKRSKYGQIGPTPQGEDKADASHEDSRTVNGQQ